MGEKILLDSEVFKALASQTRLEILKELDERKKTVTELSRIMELNKATIYEHLNILNTVGLVTKVESSNKWVYYRLSWKATDLLHPEKKRIAIVLSAAIMFLVMGLIYVLTYMREFAQNYVSLENDIVLRTDLTNNYSETFSMVQGADSSILLLGIIMFALFVMTFIAALWIWKTSPPSPIIKTIDKSP